MIGSVNRYNPVDKIGFIYSFTNKWTYRFKVSDVDGFDIANGYIVDFHVAFDDEFQKKCAKGIHVIDSSVGIYKDNSGKSKKKKNNSKHKSCNADKVLKDDKSFNRFVRNFMRGE